MEGSDKVGYPLPQESSYAQRPEQRAESAHQQQHQTNVHLSLPYPHQGHLPLPDDLPRPYQPYNHAASYPPLPQPYTTATMTSPAPAAVPMRYTIDGQVNGQMNGHNTTIPAVTPIKQDGGRVSMEGSFTSQLGTNTGDKKVRLRKACDSCSHRKVKCDDQEPSCRECLKHGVTCTRERESKQRGPTNKNIQQLKVQQAQAFKRKRDEQSSPDHQLSPMTQATSLSPMSSSGGPVHLSRICPLPVLELLVEDYFTYIHPLAPLPHEPSFYAAFRNPEKHSNPVFVALVASMIGVLVASFPRRPRMHLKSQGLEHLFTRSVNFVDSCHRVAIAARGPGYLDEKPSVFCGITSYFLGLASAYTHQWQRSRLYFAESLSIIRVLGAHSSKDPSFSTGGTDTSTFAVDLIQKELGRRLWWVIFIGVRSLSQLGANFRELVIPPPTPSYPYPPYPTEVDDEFIHTDKIQAQPAGVISRMTGYNVGLEVYMSTTPISTWGLMYGINYVFDWNHQQKVLDESIQQIKNIFNNLPKELKLSPGSEPGQFEQMQPPDQASQHQHPYMSGQYHADGRTIQRRNLQYEIQKANLYASQLGTRSHLIEMYGSMQEQMSQNHSDNFLSQSNDAIDQKVANEREAVVHDLLRALRSISRVNMEPSSESFVNNPSVYSSHMSSFTAPLAPFIVQHMDEAIYGSQHDNIAYYEQMPDISLRACRLYLTDRIFQINKIRQVASTLISTPQNRKGDIARRAEEYLPRFLDLIIQLEHAGSPDGDSEEEDLQHWADIRELQMQFARSGGFLLQ